MKKGLWLILVLGMWFFGATHFLNAETEVANETAVKTEKSSSNVGTKAIAAAIAVGLSALASGLAQARIGAAGAGALAEKPEVVGSVIILEAIPETMIILGFVVAVLIIFVL